MSIRGSYRQMERGYGYFLGIPTLAPACYNANTWNRILRFIWQRRRRIYGCVPPFTHPVTQRVEGLSLGNPQHPEKGTLSPDRSECSAVGLRQTGSHHGFSPAVGADASLTPSWTHAGACPCLFSADIAKLDPSDHQRIGESSQDAGHPALGYPVSAVAVEAWHALHCAHSQRYSPAAG